MKEHANKQNNATKNNANNGQVVKE
jgi:hypothetical protein